MRFRLWDRAEWVPPGWDESQAQVSADAAGPVGGCDVGTVCAPGAQLKTHIGQ